MKAVYHNYEPETMDISLHMSPGDWHRDYVIDEMIDWRAAIQRADAFVRGAGTITGREFYKMGEGLLVYRVSYHVQSPEEKQKRESRVVDINI